MNWCVAISNLFAQHIACWVVTTNCSIIAISSAPCPFSRLRSHVKQLSWIHTCCSPLALFNRTTLSQRTVPWSRQGSPTSLHKTKTPRTRKQTTGSDRRRILKIRCSFRQCQDQKIFKKQFVNLSTDENNLLCSFSQTGEMPCVALFRQFSVVAMLNGSTHVDLKAKAFRLDHQQPNSLGIN